MKKVTRKPRGASRESIGWYAERLGEPDLDKNWVGRLSPEAFSVFSKPKPIEIVRTEKMLEYTHHAYPIPAAWGEPGYALLHVEVGDPPIEVEGSSQSDDFMWHGGEEILVAESGALDYEFYWPRNSNNDLLTAEVSADALLGQGKAIRILPHVPHRNRNRTKGGKPAKAWMVIRHLSGSMAAIEAHERRSDDQGVGRLAHVEDHAVPDEVSKKEKPGKVSLKHLRGDSTRAFLLISDVPSRLRTARMRSGFTVTELANEVATHSQYIWRLERGATNINTVTMEAIAKKVRIDLKDLGIPRHFKVDPPPAPGVRVS